MNKIILIIITSLMLYSCTNKEAQYTDCIIIQEAAKGTYAKDINFISQTNHGNEIVIIYQFLNNKNVSITDTIELVETEDGIIIASLNEISQ